MNGIVDYGKRLFDRYYGKQISFQELRDELTSKMAKISSNDIAVLGCYCENDVEVTLMLHELENIRLASDFKHDSRQKFAFMRLCTEIKHCALPLDAYFKCNRFVPMVVKAWKTVLAEHWKDLLIEGEEACKTLNFFQPILDKYLK